jgi:hypothetical protein
MPDPQLTPAQFAASIKEKYPQYKAVPDEQLARAMVDKYPQYAKQVTFGSVKPGKTAPASTSATSNDVEKREVAGSSMPQLRAPATGWKGLKAKAYTAADRLLPMLPAVGSTIGGLTAGAGTAEAGFLGAPVGAMEGGVIGEGTRNVLSRAIFPKDEERMADERDPVKEAKRIIEQGALGFGTELGARGVGAIGSKIIRPFEASAATVKAAKAGEGVRMTPGEAGNSPSLGRIEKVLGHLPGGSGPIEGFREAQSHDALAMMDKQLNSLSTNRLSDEETGKAVQKIVADSRKALTAQESTKYDEVKQLLGVDPKTFMTPEQIDSAVEKKIAFYKQMGGGTPDVVGKLQAARNFTRTSRADVETKVMDRLMRKEPELMGEYLRKSSLANLREFNKLMPGPVRQQAAANVLQSIITGATDAQTKQINQRVFATALKDLGEGRGRLIFGAQYPAIREGSELLNRIAPMAGSGGAMSAMHTVRQLIEVGSVAAAAIGFSGHAYSAAAAVGGPVLAMRFIATALTHPQASAAVLKALRATAAGTFRSVPYAVNAIAAPDHKSTYLQAPTP